MRGKLSLLIIFFASITLLAAAEKKTAPTEKEKSKKAGKWNGAIPKVAQEAKDWAALVDELDEHQLIYGKMAAAHRMLLFFDDLSVKEKAYRSIVDIVDAGYIYSTRGFFVTGDLSPQEDADFINSYSLYKAMVTDDAGMKKWSDYYFSKVDKEKFPKYLFYEAMKSYAKKDKDKALEKLRQILKLEGQTMDVALVRKITRMIARIYFEKEQYRESLDVYLNFLLKLNPVTSSDWLEAAWNAYYLEQYPEALGFLYNLEGKTKDPIVNLEQYVLRALIYKSMCSTDGVGVLLTNFEADFGNTIRGIKTGQTLKGLENLLLAFHPENQAIYRVYISQGELRREMEQIKKISKRLRPLADYLFQTEINSMDREMQLGLEPALDRAAKQMLVLFESLRFLSFDVAREKYRPEVVFQPKEETKLLVEDLQDERFVLHWTQMGDFWRDERLKYKAQLKNQCLE
jgi:tetratricopeptide (TPR) repeat protein